MYKIDGEIMNILIVGTGYVGLVQAVGLGILGYPVVCYDKNKEIIENLRKSKISIYEPGISKNLKKLIQEGKISFEDNETQAFKNKDIIFICVNTPIDEHNNIDTSYFYNAIDACLKNITKNCILVIKSTVPIGTANNINKLIKRKSKYKIDVISNPEFLSQGTALKDFLDTKRVIIGTNNIKSQPVKIIKNIYKKLNKPIIITSNINAEIIKYASNSFLAMKISFINEISNICDLCGADINIVSEGMKLDDRIGDKYLSAGVGFGGSCLKKDVTGFINSAKQLGFSPTILESIISRNNQQNFYLVEKLKKEHNLTNKTIAILGLSFKPNSDDIRDSIAIKNILELKKYNCNNKVYEPRAMKNTKKILPELNFCNTIEKCLKKSDFCLIFTEWEQIKRINPKTFKKNMNSAIIFDGRNCFDVEKMKKCDVKYYSVGRPS